jgi:xanthine dehydrogenase accessory factor
MNEAIYRRLLELAQMGGEAVLVTVVQKQGSGPQVPGAKMLVEAQGIPLGTVGGGELEQVAGRLAIQLLAERRCDMVTYALLDGGKLAGTQAEAQQLGMVCGGTVTLFYEYLGYQTHIYLFGGGHVGQAVARHLIGSGCYVTVVDERPEIAAVPGANRLLTADYATALSDEAVPAGAYFLIGTPSHTHDYEMLRRIMTSAWAPRYVGMLGSRKKSEELVRRLREKTADAIDLGALHTPVGLDLGGATPDEIAISIVAEIQALRYGKEGHRHMRANNPALR